MVDNTNQSTKPSNGESNIQKYIGVASVNIVAINPSNDKLRKYGWQIAEGAEEPKYSSIIEKNGRKIENCRVRFLVQIMDLDDKPVIPLDFWVRNEYEINKNGDKCKIIDSYVRTAWATKEDVQAKRVPQYSNGPASISSQYTLSHIGQEAILKFLFKYLNITPFRVFDRAINAFVPSKNPGRLTIDKWADLCRGNVSEIAEYASLQPDNCVKVILGVHVTDENKTYQTFMTDDFLSNGSFPDKNTGEYTRARKLIDEFFKNHENSTDSFEATPVREWKEVATEVHDNANGLYDEGAPVVQEPDSFEAPSDDEMPF